MKQRTELLIIDPQIDFCDSGGALYVPGAEEDMRRLAQMVRRTKDQIDCVHVTLDSHRTLHIAHPIFWADAEGRHPQPFTQISRADVEQKRWTTTRPQMYSRALEYVRALDESGRYKLTIWPPHCLIGSAGHSVHPELFAALQEWEAREVEEGFALVDFVTKGSNVWTEHYSAVRADVPDPEDASTQLNTRLVETLRCADTVLVAGEALTHCVANTVRDIADSWDDADLIKRMVLLEDATSGIQGFEAEAASFLNDMRARGMRITTTAEYAA